MPIIRNHLHDTDCTIELTVLQQDQARAMLYDIRYVRYHEFTIGRDASGQLRLTRIRRRNDDDHDPRLEIRLREAVAAIETEFGVELVGATKQHKTNRKRANMTETVRQTLAEAERLRIKRDNVLGDAADLLAKLDRLGGPLGHVPTVDGTALTPTPRARENAAQAAAPLVGIVGFGLTD